MENMVYLLKFIELFQFLRNEPEKQKAEHFTKHNLQQK